MSPVGAAGTVAMAALAACRAFDGYRVGMKDWGFGFRAADSLAWFGCLLHVERCVRREPPA